MLGLLGAEARRFSNLFWFLSNFVALHGIFSGTGKIGILDKGPVYSHVMKMLKIVSIPPSGLSECVLRHYLVPR